MRVAADGPVAPAPQPTDGGPSSSTTLVYGPPSLPVVNSTVAPPDTTAAPAPTVNATSAPVTTEKATEVRIASVTTTRPPTRRPTPTTTAPPKPRHTQSGPASWYGAPAGTCAHQSLPFGTVVEIRDVDNGNTATCTVEDRGPYEGGRIIDLAPDVFSRLAPTSEGVVNVQISWS